MEKLLTTSELAEAIGASQSSMRRWTNSGVIRTARTAGGHRRIALSEAIRFIRETGTTVVRPEVLGLPELTATVGGKSLASRSLEHQLLEMLRTGSTKAAIGCVTGMFLSGLNVASICDGAMHGAMEQIGELWRKDPRGILIEHRATDICLQALGMLRQLMPEPAENAPVALGGAPQGDPYLLPSMMVGTVLLEAGYHDMNFGPETPLELLAAAAQENKARLVWLSVKADNDRGKLRKKIDELAARLEALGITFVIGGSAAESLGLRSSKNVHVMRTLGELSAFAHGAAATPQQKPDQAQGE